MTYKLHLIVRLGFDKAQMTTKRSKNKKVHYEQQASSLADVLTTL